MLYRVLADALVLFHLLFVAFAVAGGLLALRWRWAAALHLPALVWAAWIEFSGGICPLTPMENALRRMAGGAGYPGGFVEHYVLPVLYPAGLTPQHQWVLGGVLLALNLLVYAAVAWRWRRR
jgi:hypothetical protein